MVDEATEAAVEVEAEAEDQAEPEIEVDVRGQVTAPLDGVDYVLRPSEEAILAAERQCGCSLHVLTEKATYSRLTLDEMAIIVTEMMRAHGKADSSAGPSYSGAKVERVRTMIYEAGAPRITARLVVLLRGALTGGFTASGEWKASGTN